MAKKKKTKNTMPTVEEYEAKRKGYISVDEYEENRKNGKYSFENYQKQKQEKQKRYGNQSELKNYLNRINAGRKAIKDTITQPFAQERFKSNMVDTDPFGKRLQAMQEGKALAKVPALTYEESKALGRYTVGKKKGSNTPGVPYSENSKVYRSKEDIAAAYNAERDRRQAEYDAWKEEQRKNNKLTKSATAAEKTGAGMGDYLAGIKQKKEEKTKQTDWQAQTAHAQNSANPWEKYGEVYEAKARGGEKKPNWQQATQASTLLANNQNLAYGAKMAGVTPEEFVQKLQGTNKQLTQQEQKDNRAARLIEGKTDLGHWMGGTTEDVQETMRSGYASGFRGDVDRLRAEKYWDEGEDPYLMSDEGRANLRAKYETGILSYQKQLEELEQQIAAQEKPANGWDPLLELYSTPEIENERKIIEGDGYTEEEKRAALEHMNWLLNRNAGYGSQSANDRARNFYRYNIHNLTDLRDHMNMDNMRRMAYDAMNGNGAYEKATAGMNPEERAALDDRIDNVLDYIADPNGELGVQKRTVQGQIEYTQSKIDEIDRLNEQDAKYAEMMAGVDELGDVQIDPATVGTSRNSLLQNQYTPAHPVEYVAAILSGDYNEDVWINDLQYGQALLMSDDEKKKFADLYTHNKKNEAWAFYQGLEPMLNQMYHYFEDLSIRQTARRAPITSSIATEAMHLAQPVEALINLPEQLASAVFDTGSGVTDPYSSRYLVTRMKNGIRAQVSQDVGDWDWVYNGVMSGVDSALNVSIGKALGLDGKFLNIAGQKIPAMQAATLALFHTQAFETSLQNTLTQGNDNFGYDFIEAWIDAAVETATEIWSVENWMADPTNILRYVGKIAISEPSEEIVGAIIEPYIKEMLGHKNQYKERAKQILVDGGYTDGQGNWVKVEDMDTATRQAMREWNHDIRMAAQEALISVGPSIVYGSARMATDTNRTGRAIQSNNINGEQNATRELAEAAARMNPETESYKQSQKMLERLKSGEQISNYDAGKLATNIIRETNEQIGNTARQVLQDRVTEDLQSKGMQAEEAQEYAGLITSALEEGGIDNLTRKQRSKINGNNAALQTYMSYRFSAETQNKTAKAQLEATQGDRQSRFTAEMLMLERKTNDNLDVGEQMATDEEKRNATGKEVKGPMGIIYNNQHARLGSLMKDENGKLKYQVYLEGQKEPVLADASEIRTTHLGTAAIMRSQVRSPGFYSQGYVNAMLQAMNDRRMENIPGKLMRDAVVLRFAAYEQMSMPQTELPADIAKMLYDYSRYEYIDRRAAETSNAKNRTIKPGQGYVTYKGINSGTAEFDQLLKDNKLSKEEKQYIRMMADVAKAGGIELGLMDINDIMNSDDPALQQFKPEPEKLYGAEKNSRITINLGGQIFTKNEQTGKWEASGQKHNIVVTLGHETVHWLQENTRDGYDNLARYVIDEQRRILGTQGLNDRLEQIMNSQDVDLYGAISELVADSSDNIFFNKKVIDHIQQTKKGLYQNLKNFAKNLIARIRAAFSSMSQDSRRLGNEVGSRMAELFNLAWDEATSGELVYDEKEYSQVQKMQEDDKGVRFSNYNGLGLEEITQDQRVNIINRGNIIAETEKDLIDFIQKARADKTNQFQKTAFVGTISDKAKILLTKESGISNLFKDGAYVLGIRADDVRHYDKHFKTDEDVAQAIIDTLGMLMDHDTIDPTVMKNGKIKIVLRKGNNSIQLLSVTEYSKSQRATTIKSVYLTKGNIENWRKLNRVVTLSSLRNSTRSPLHSNNITQHITDGNIKFSQAQLDDDYMAAVESGNMDAAQKLVYEAGRRAGWAIKAHHGTNRGDRVGNVFRPERATSGPMAYFTDNREIAENYARDKRDTSIDYDPDYHEEGWEDYDLQFKVKDENGKMVPVRMLWDKMKYAEKQKFIENAKHITTNDDGEIIYDEDTNDGLGNYDEYTLRDYKGNGIDALVYSWLKAGELLGDEGSFLQVLELAGIKDAKWYNPNESHEKVYDVLLKILNPFDTSTMYNPDFVEELQNWYYGEQGHSVHEKANGETYNWDKNGITVWNWIQYAWDEVKTGGTGNWTRIPDGVTDFLKYKGYDGIKDNGGKGGGEQHTVWIPFSSEQVKSADPVTYDDDGNVIPLSERFNAEKTDIRFSQAQTDPRQMELSQAWQDARDEANDLREQLRALKPEMDAWVDRLTDAQINGTLDEAMEEYKKWEEGYTKVSEAMIEAERRYKEANKAYDDYIEQRDVAAEQKKISESGLSEPEYRRKQAVNEFGYTTDFREAGYLLPNGRMLNFTGEKGKHYGMRGEDHRGIGRIYASSKYQGGEAMMAFMRDGNIRVMAETPGVDIISTKEPTAEQYAAIRNMARRFAGEEYFNVDFTDEKGYNEDSIEYDGRVNPDRIVNDIKTYFRTGVAPQQSVVDQFHFSRWTEEGLDVNTWMMNATPSTFQTEDEQALWQAYKDLRIKMSLSLHRQNEYQAKIKQLESKANLTAEERDELTANRNRLEIQQKKLADMEDELYQVTSSEGYAGMMYRQNMVLKDYIQGKTQDQVRQTVEGMLKEVQRAQEEIKKDRADLLKLAETQAVKTVESYMSKSSLGKMAGMLRSNYNSAMSKGEIQSRLAEMALKQAQGEDITSDAEQLAQDLLDKMRGIQTDALQQLKGTTLKISEELAKEMRAENLTMADLRRQLKGSGVTIKTEKGANIRQQWAEMYDQNQSLPNIDEDYSESGALHHILDFIQGEVDASRGVNQNDVNFDEVAAVVKIAAGNITTYLVDDPAARRQIENLMGQVKELAGKTGAIAEKMDALDKKMDEVVLAGQKAKGWTTILQRDVNDAIKYYNKTARVAAQVEKTKVRKALIEQLRSENTKKLLAQQDAFKERMKNDKTARELAQDNMIIRRKINTVAGRMAQRLFAETDQKNIPEETKALARQMMQMLTMHDSLHRKVTFMDRQQLRDITERLQKLAATEGTFNADTDLSWLIIGEGEDADTSLVDRVMQDLVDIESGLLEYRTAEGQKNVTLQDRKNALTKVQKALSEIWSMIQARGQAQIQGREMQILDLAMMMEEDMADSAFKGERTGFGRKARNAISGAINYGNLTPEYFFKNLKNRAMDQLKLGLNDAENRGGLEAAKAKAKIAQLAAETGFNSWDGQEKHEIDVANGKKVTATTEQIMSLYATWLRERNATRPEETAHLLKGGFVLTPNEEGGKPGRQKTVQRPIRITWNQLNKLGSYLTEEQKRWVDGVVAYMSGELAELGNEASMQMYGIKKFTEKYYFPIRSWGGVLNSRSDAGVSSQNENRAAQQSFTKRVKANANNAVQISDFTPTAMKHITGMITFNTIGPAVENINKVLNQQLTYDENKGKHEGLPTEENEELDTSYKRNMAAAFQEAYGKQAFDYLKTFMKDLNGGFARRQEVLLREKLLSIFKKNAVAGSLSVAAQQPLSYIRAAMMINPKYLAAAISPQYWKGSYAEMMKYSGLAVIKEMGKFDMNYGQTMQDYIAPEGMESKAHRAWNKVSDVMTAGPQKMDAMTWTRMWTAVKLEQMAQNKGADFKSDEFLEKVAERFNDLMRRTQVYDSVMVKSQNMRSDKYLKKVATSFMAEPTLSLNVLEDAWANRKETGGKKNVIKALATFLLSAAAQAGAKAFFGTGRTPDKKKNKEENFLNKFGYNILSELNPLGLIPGYSQIINVLTDGELKDDAMGVLGKAVEVWDRIFQLATGKIGDKGLYRDLEDSIGQLLQLTTDIPAKNLMRDFRAMVNFFSNGEAFEFTGDGYAHRPTSNAVLKYQALDTFMSNDLIGLINKRLGEAGYGTNNKDYYTRIYNAERSGNQAAADEMKEYLLTGKGVSEKTLNENIRPMYKNDDDLSSEEKLERQKEYGLKQTTSYITAEYKAGNLTREAAERLYREENPNAKDKNVMELFDKIDWEKAGHDAEGYTNYTPLMTAIENNKVDEIRAAVDHMVKNGYTEKDIRSEVNSRLKKEYMAATSESEKLRIRDALTKTYKALGYDASEADKTVQKWIDEAKKNK